MRSPVVALVRYLFSLCLIVCFINFCSASVIIKERSPRRVNIPSIGLGYECNGCPEHYCDDDGAIVYGYCCGCARFFDYLPVKCSATIKCPPNGQQLCQDYEYMMHCCCD